MTATATLTRTVFCGVCKTAGQTIEHVKNCSASYYASKNAPAPVVVKPVKIDVAAGRYAVEIDGVLKFYRVDKPTNGQWAGRTFVKLQASDELYPVKNPAARTVVLELIAIDPQSAMIRYGQELGKCGHCGRTLTDEASREAGIGPICKSRL